MMKTAEILKVIDYKITGGSVLFDKKIEDKILKKYQIKNEIRCIEYSDDVSEFNKRKYDGDITITGEEVLRITLSFPNQNGYFRWTNEKYKSFFKEIAKKYDYDDKCAFDNVIYTEVFMHEEIIEKIEQMLKTGTCSYDVSYQLDVETEFLDIAEKTAQKEGVSVENWLEKTIKENYSQFKKKI